MANQIQTPDAWPLDVRQIAQTDPVLGGPEGPVNLMGAALSTRGFYQRLRNITPWDAALGAYPSGACVMYAGLSWRSKVAGNTAVPGTDAAKWERWGFSRAELQAELPNLDAVVNNTYIGPTPIKLNAFTPNVVLSDMATPGVNYILQTLPVSGARRIRIFGHASFRNDSTSASCSLGMALYLNGSNVFGGHYLGAVIPAKSGVLVTQIPVSILDAAFALDPAQTYTITLRAKKDAAVGPIVVLDSYIDVEYV